MNIYIYIRMRLFCHPANATILSLDEIRQFPLNFHLHDLVHMFITTFLKCRALITIFLRVIRNIHRAVGNKIVTDERSCTDATILARRFWNSLTLL